MDLGKWWFSSGGVFSEQTGPHEAKWCHWRRRASPWDIWIIIFENIVFIWIKKNLDQMVVFVGRGFLGADGPL